MSSCEEPTVIRFHNRGLIHHLAKGLARKPTVIAVAREHGEIRVLGVYPTKKLAAQDNYHDPLMVVVTDEEGLFGVIVTVAVSMRYSLQGLTVLGIDGTPYIGKFNGVQVLE